MALSLAQTFQLFKADLTRRLVLEGKTPALFSALTIIFHRGVVTVFLYRFSRYFHLKEHFFAKIMVRLLRYIEFHYCRNEIEAGAEIDAGLVLNDCGGIGLSDAVIIGKNCTFMGRATIALGAVEGVEVGKDKISIGNNCTIGHNVRIISDVTIADGVQIKSNAVVLQSVSTVGAVLDGFPARKVAELPMASIALWSPLMPGKCH